MGTHSPRLPCLIPPRSQILQRRLSRIYLGRTRHRQMSLQDLPLRRNQFPLRSQTASVQTSRSRSHQGNHTSCQSLGGISGGVHCRSGPTRSGILLSLLASNAQSEETRGGRFHPRPPGYDHGENVQTLQTSC